MRATEPVDDREAVARDAFLERVGLDVETTEAGYGRAEISVISSWAHSIRESFDLMPTDTEQGWDDIGARLAGIPPRWPVTDDAAGEAEAGRVVAKRQYAEIAGQVRRWTGQEGASGDFFANLVAAAPESRATSCRARAGAASTAYADLGRWLETELAPRGRDREAAGRERYALASREFLGAAVDLEETYRGAGRS